MPLRFPRFPLAGCRNIDRQFPGAQNKSRKHAPAALRAIRALLCERRDQLLGTVVGAMRDLQEADTGAGDFADAAQGAHAADVSAGVLDMSNASLAETVAAIERLNSGTYGTCARCSHQIALTRLQALPTVRFCMECQRAVEQEVVLRGNEGKNDENAD